jgi:hypothetical protein
MKKLFFLLAAIILLTACVPSLEAIQKAIAKTQTALPINTLTPTPTPTSTPIPLSEINLDNILLLPGDLPEGYTVEPITDENPVGGLARGEEKRVCQEFEKKDTGSGFVCVDLFEETEKRDQDYDQTFERIFNQLETAQEDLIDIKDIGENGKLIRNDISLGVGSRIIYSNFLFLVRCHAFISIYMVSDDKTERAIQSYAKKLDERLSNVICR